MEKIEFNQGDRIYKYQLATKIGGGHFGEVWLAHDASIDTMVAVKVIQAPSGEIIDKLAEAHIGNLLDHPNLVRVHYADVVKIQNGIGLAIIAMDYLENGAVINQINPCGFLPIPKSVKFTIDTLRGLEHLHGNDYFHNDIKPSNILIGKGGDGILTDFGISSYSEGLVPVRPPASYILHQAPEVIETGTISVQSDIYQVGLTAFRLINGVNFLNNKVAKLDEDGFRELVQLGLVKSSDFLPYIPLNLKRVINKAINPDPARRYQYAVEMRRALERLYFSGYWDCGRAGNMFGEDEKYTYSFEIAAKTNGKNNFTVWRKNKESCRETRITKYCKKNITKNELEILQKNFMQAVVTGTL